MHASEEYLRRYLYEELDEADQAEIEAHLRDCPLCFKKLEERADEDARPLDPTYQAGLNLLFGGLALQYNFSNRDDLLAAFTAWVADKDQSLAQILVDRGALDHARRALLEPLVTELLKQHGGDPGASLAAVGSLGSVRDDLSRIADPDVQAILAHVSAALGRSTSDGIRFRVLREHAKGGLGEVFEALDTELNRSVALKKIQDKYADDPHFRARFEFEAEVTGGLEHPGIVPVYGLGHTPDGRPFYAMRFIKRNNLRGDTLKDAIQLFHEAEKQPRRDPGQSTLELRELLNRFIDVCDAMEYAHSRGVLHRDLKPGNIMLGNYGETLVVDWGLAKAIDLHKAASPIERSELPLKPASGSALEPTSAGTAVGTPAYMSPEQAALALVKDGDSLMLKEAAEPLGSATDVYGLGAILFALLTGGPPVEGKSDEEILGRVQRGEIRQPRSLNPRIAPALEVVCLKALALKPQDRYESAKALKDDLKRWLADEPVSVYRDPWTTRLLRWARKHRATTMTTVGTVLTILLATAVIAAIKIEDNRQLTIAYGNLETANGNLAKGLEREKKLRQDVESRYGIAKKAIEAFHTGVSDDVHLKNPELKELRDRLLHQAIDFYKQLSAILKESESPDRAKQSELAENYLQLAELTGDVGSATDSLAASEEALRLYEELARVDSSDPKLIVSQAMIHHDIAASHRNTGRLDDALNELNESKKLLTSLPAAAMMEASPRSVDAMVESALGDILSSMGQHRVAMKHYETARTLLEALPKEGGDNRKYTAGLAYVLRKIGRRNRETGAMAEAEDAFAEAERLYRGLRDRYPGALDYEFELANSLDGLGGALLSLGQTDKALKSFKESLAIREEIAKAYPTNTHYRMSLADSHTLLAGALIKEGQFKEAFESHREAITIRTRLVDEQPTILAHRANLAQAHFNLGVLLGTLGQHGEAVSSLRSGLAIMEALTREYPKIVDYRAELAEMKSILATELSKDRSGLMLRLEGSAEALKLEVEAIDAFGALVNEFPKSLSHKWNYATLR